MSNLGELCLNFFSKSIPAKGKPKVSGLYVRRSFRSVYRAGYHLLDYILLTQF